MVIPKAIDILTISDDSVAHFIREQTSARTLSTIMKDLNNDLLSDDVTASDLAAKALRHLGFPLRP
ncbi:MAG: hypothetical protein AAF376_00560 [Pseudomonadota bacterium]